VRRPGDTAPECDRCESERWVWTHDPSLDGHGGLNGGGWAWYPCADCNYDGILPRRDVAGHPLRRGA
jgi:hypothetical protein